MNVNEYLSKGKNEVKEIIKEAREINKKYNYFNYIDEDATGGKGKLSNLPVSVKDCICVKDMESRAGSLILKGYKPVFDATVISRLRKEGVAIIGKTSQDEFGFGSFSTNTDNIPKNPIDVERSTGGSSGGSGGFTAITKYTHVSIAESTGGSIACPAGFCGVAGFTPTYGIVSRYGLIDYANSLDKIGVMAKKVNEIKPVFDVIKGYDEKDSTSLKLELNEAFLKKPSGKIKIGVIKESLNVDSSIKDKVLGKLKDYEEVSLPLVEKYGVTAYYIIALSEASTNLAKYSGLRYGESLDLKGNYNDYFSDVRSKFFSNESKRRIILGTFARMAGYRDAYYLKAMKVRNLIIQEYKKAFKKYDLLISPTMPIIAPKFTDISKLTPLESYMMDIMTVGPNLAGLPHLSVNAGYVGKMPVGLMVIGNHLDDNKVLKFGESLDN